MMERHLTPEELAALLSAPDAPEQGELVRHVAHCTECAIRLQMLGRIRVRADAQVADAPEPCAFSERVVAYVLGDRGEADLVEEHLLTCDACRELLAFCLGGTAERQAEEEAVERIRAFYGVASLVLLSLMPKPAVALRDGREEREYSTGVDGALPEVSIEYSQQGDARRYTIAVEAPGASIDLFDAQGNLLASYGEGTRSLFASASAWCIVLNGQHMIRLQAAEGAG